MYIFFYCQLIYLNWKALCFNSCCFFMYEIKGTCLVPVQHAPLTFPLGDEVKASLLHVGAQLLHHAVNAVVQHEGPRLGANGLPADGTLVLALPPRPDAVQAETVGAVQGHRLAKEEVKEIVDDSSE